MSLKAPFLWRIGIGQIYLGSCIAPGVPVVTLQQLDLIFADFYLLQKSLARIKMGQSVIVASSRPAPNATLQQAAVFWRGLPFQHEPRDRNRPLAGTLFTCSWFRPSIGH